LLLEPVRGDQRIDVPVAHAQRERPSVRLAPADVDEPGAVELDEEDEVSQRVARFARGRIDGLAGQKGGLEPQLSQQTGEEPVQLVTESAAAADDDLVEERVRLEGERPPGGDVEVLERDGEEVGEVQLGEAVEGAGGRPLEADPLEIEARVHELAV